MGAVYAPLSGLHTCVDAYRAVLYVPTVGTVSWSMQVRVESAWLCRGMLKCIGNTSFTNSGFWKLFAARALMFLPSYLVGLFLPIFLYRIFDGRVHECRDRSAKEYVTTCFVVRATKKVLTDTRTEDEKKNGLRVEWFNRDEAVQILMSQVETVRRGEVGYYNSAFNIARDAFFFQTYIQSIE